MIITILEKRYIDALKEIDYSWTHVLLRKRFINKYIYFLKNIYGQALVYFSYISMNNKSYQTSIVM